MNKKLMAVAVAAAMAPGLALAQSSVTISGFFKTSFEQIRIGNGTASARTGLNASEWRVSDNSSRLIFNVTEDLGGGMQAVGQLDIRFSSSDSPQTLGNGGLGGVSGGNTWVGLQGKSWGRVTMGKHDLHYGKAGDDVATKSGSLQAWNEALFGYAMQMTAASAPANASIAATTRTQNVVRYDTPQWGIFSGTLAYSTSGVCAGSGSACTESDLATGSRKGGAWNINPRLTGANWQVEYSYWRAKPDQAPGSTTNLGVVQGAVNDQRGDTLAGFYRWGGLKAGLAWNKSKITGAPTNATAALQGIVIANRTAWAIPVSYEWGRHTVYGTYTKAGNNKGLGGGISGANTSANMLTLAYNYDLSKRTAAGVTYSRINNASNAAYNFFYNANSALGSTGSGTAAGEDPRLIAFTIKHAF